MELAGINSPATALVAGVVTSLHCAGMCGPLACGLQFGLGDGVGGEAGRFAAGKAELARERRVHERGLAHAGARLAVVLHVDGDALDHVFDAQAALTHVLQQAAGEHTVAAAAVLSQVVGGGRVDHDGAGRGVGRGRQAAVHGPKAARPRVVAAGIEDDDVEAIAGLVQLGHQVLEVERFVVDVGAGLELGLGGHQVVLAIDLQAVARLPVERVWS